MMNRKLNAGGKESSGTSPRSAVKMTKALLSCGLVAGPLFVLVVVVQIVTRAGFDFGRHPISLLSLGELGWIQIANFVVSGLLVIAFAVGIRRVWHSGRGATWGPLLVALYGLGLVIAGVFSAEPALGFPPGTPEGIPTTFGLNVLLHGVGFLLAFGSVTIAALVVAVRDMEIRMRRWALYSAITAVATVALIAWPFQETASVRYFAASVVVWIWTTMIALRLMTGYPVRAPAGTSSS